MNFVIYVYDMLLLFLLTLSLLLNYILCCILSTHVTMQVHRSSMTKKCYAVYVGKVPGVYNEWPECQAQVHQFSGGSQRGFDSRAEAEDSYLRWCTLARERDRNRRLKNYIIALLLIVIALVFYIFV